MPTNLWTKGQSGNPAGGKRKTIATRDLSVITKLAAKGVREKDIARACGVSEPTWTRLKSDTPAVVQALDAGRQIMHDALVGKLFERAMKGDVVPNLFLLKTTFGYREGDTPTELRPTINIVMNGAASTADEYVKGITVEATPLDLPAPDKVPRD